MQAGAVETSALVALGNSADIGGCGTPPGWAPASSAGRCMQQGAHAQLGRAMRPGQWSILLLLCVSASRAAPHAPAMPKRGDTARAPLASRTGASKPPERGCCPRPCGHTAAAGREITRQAEACGCESLVMGSRGLGLSKKALMGLLGVGSGALPRGWRVGAGLRTRLTDRLVQTALRECSSVSTSLTENSTAAYSAADLLLPTCRPAPPVQCPTMCCVMRHARLSCTRIGPTAERQRRRTAVVLSSTARRRPRRHPPHCQAAARHRCCAPSVDASLVGLAP